MLFMLLVTILFICFANVKHKKDPPLDGMGGFIEEDVEYDLKSII